MLNANDSKVLDFLKAWETNHLECYLKPQKLDCEANVVAGKTHAHQRTKFIALDIGSSGHFMVDRNTEMVYSTKGYGVPNLKKPRGKIEFLTNFINGMTAKGEEYMHQYWYSLHPIE